MLTLKDFDYELPRELIAPYPERKRSEAKLLVLERETGKIEHRIFKNLTEYLQAGDLLVLNNTKVLPARLFGRKPTGGKVEGLLLKRLGETDWEILLKPSGRVKKGTKIIFGENGVRLEGEILDEPDRETGIRKIRFRHPERSEGSCFGTLRPCGAQNDTLQQILRKIGRIPLPPYLDRPDEAMDRERYQTVFAEKEGAVASPTAGLHFDEKLLKALQRKGVELCFVTLHVGYGTFQPVQTEDLSKHEIDEEEFEVTEETAGQIQKALKERRRIVACGTTVVRVLETMASRKFTRGETRLFIYPPYEFKLVDAMITNFHLPRTTLLMLVSAFAAAKNSKRGQAPFGGRNLIFRAYHGAIRERYRFYSYGDAMLIL